MDLCRLDKDCIPAVGVGILCKQCENNARGTWCVMSGGVWCDGAGRTAHGYMCLCCYWARDTFCQGKELLQDKNKIYYSNLTLIQAYLI